jgi:hypothetical protein
MIYTHVLNRGGRGVQSPADRLLTLNTELAWDRPRANRGIGRHTQQLPETWLDFRVASER